MSELMTSFVPVQVEYLPGDGLSVARFAWQDSPPLETYTIPLNDFVSIELDQHSPVRPNSVSVYDEGAEISAETLTTVIGEELTEALLQVKNVGIGTLSIALNANNRFAIAGLQAASPSTPLAMRKTCQGMVNEHERAAALIPQPLLPSRLVPRTRNYGQEPKLGMTRPSF